MVAAIGPVPYHSDNATMPGLDGFAVTPSDSVNFNIAARSLYIGVTGDVVLITPAGTVLTFKSVAVGILPIMCIRINSTNTTATNIIGII